MADSLGSWSAPFYGLQHLQSAGKKSRVTVDDRGAFAELQCWFPGCGFSPILSTHGTAEEARKAGERWIAEAA